MKDGDEFNPCRKGYKRSRLEWVKDWEKRSNLNKEGKKKMEETVTKNRLEVGIWKPSTSNERKSRLDKPDVTT
ncbi:hypothetical protein Phum_PHUM148610 [Pediculus humanus corporis]|uniref:Uncharacterized protein n=1 Tax=Pediculus humanus subsp. corporis TaxID=121224 RepID=E0VF12_PEDHC|nr:uncharacterized protein Phum_PHUM148610 [Pediculus humanus corporis]EEB11986.1 hypothetical protein Phum_PHUM148610 [Pediculus humanus corporis]